jgi:hypothetical protein
MTCTASGVAVAGQYANLGTVTGMTVIGPATHSDPSHYFGSFPDMDVEVNVNGVDADTPPGLHILVGSSVDVILTVTNTGNVPISAIDGWLSWSVVYPTSGVGSTSLYPIDALAVGEVYTASLYSNSSIANADYWYQVVATGTTPVGTVTDSDQAYFSGAVPGIDIEVHTNGFDADTATGPIITMGDAVSWQYVVENTGEVPLSDVAVTDDQGVTVSCPGSNLTIGASMTCTSSGVAVPGQYANLGTVTANSVLGSVTDSDPSHYLGSSSRIDIELSTNGEDADMAPGPSVEVGDTVIWTYAVTNTGDVPLTGVLVTADVSPPPGCSIDLLPVAATLTCSHSGMVTPGLFEIVGTVTANGDLGLVTDSDPSHHFGIQAGIDIEVHTNGIDADAAPGPYLTPGSAATRSAAREAAWRPVGA